MNILALNNQNIATEIKSLNQQNHKTVNGKTFN